MGTVRLQAVGGWKMYVKCFVIEFSVWLMCTISKVNIYIKRFLIYIGKSKNIGGSGKEGIKEEK